MFKTKIKTKSELVSLTVFRKLLENLPPNTRIRVYSEEEVVIRTNMKPKKPKNKNQYSIDDLAEMIISNKNEMRKGFKKINNRIDKLEHRMDKMDKRLDYIVTANKLKDVNN